MICIGWNLGCNGAVTLSGLDHDYKNIINSASLKTRRRKRRSIKIKNRDTKKLLSFQIVTFEGNCCWKVWNKYTGGQPSEMKTLGTHQPGWLIRAVELIPNCA